MYFVASTACCAHDTLPASCILLCLLVTRRGTFRGISRLVTACHGGPRLNAGQHAIIYREVYRFAHRHAAMVPARCCNIGRHAAACRGMSRRFPPRNFLRHPIGCRERSRGISHETSHGIPRDAPWCVPRDLTTCRDIPLAVQFSSAKEIKTSVVLDRSSAAIRHVPRTCREIPRPPTVCHKKMRQGAPRRATTCSKTCRDVPQDARLNSTLALT